MLNEVDDILTQAEGIILQDAIDNTDGTYGKIKTYIKNEQEKVFRQENIFLFELYENVLETLEWSIKDIKPFK